MMVRDECRNGKSWTAVSVGEGNFSQLRDGQGNIFVFPHRSLVESRDKQYGVELNWIELGCIITV